MSDSSSCRIPALAAPWPADKYSFARHHSSICPTPHPHRELPQLLESLGTADKGGYQELHPLPRKAGWVIATGSQPSSTPGICKPPRASLLGKCYSSYRHHCTPLHEPPPCYLRRNFTEHTTAIMLSGLRDPV